MKLVLNIKKLVCCIVFYFPMTYLALSLISDKFARTFVQIFIILLLVCEIKHFGCYGRSRKRHAFSLIFLFLLVFINAILFGYHYLFKLDFYGFVLLMLLFTAFSEDNYLNCIRNFLLNNKSKKIKAINPNHKPIKLNLIIDTIEHIKPFIIIFL